MKKIRSIAVSTVLFAGDSLTDGTSVLYIKTDLSLDALLDDDDTIEDKLEKYFDFFSLAHLTTYDGYIGAYIPITESDKYYEKHMDELDEEYLKVLEENVITFLKKNKYKVEYTHYYD